MCKSEKFQLLILFEFYAFTHRHTHIWYNAQELIRDIYANIILLDAHYSSVVQEQIDEGHYDYLLKDHWVQEIQGEEE